jgi:hypothetical protein
VLVPQGYLDYINALPHTAPPGVFGLHDNADIAKDLSEAQQLLDGLLLSQSTSTTSAAAAASSSSHNARASCKGGPADAAHPDTAAAAAVSGSEQEGAAVVDAVATADSSQAADATAAAAAAQATHTQPAVQSREDVIAEIASDILAQLPPVFDLEAAEASYPQDYFNSMNTVLVQVRRLEKGAAVRTVCQHGCVLVVFVGPTFSVAQLGSHT